MGNLLQYTNKSTTIDNKIDSLLSQINYDYNNGNIRTETEYYYKIKNMLSDFYNSLTKPIYKYRPAISTPISSDYNSMIIEANKDMEYIIKDCETLGDFVSQSFVDADLTRTMMSNELAYITKKITAIGESVTANQSLGTVIFTELFNDLEMMSNTNSARSCHVNTSDGILTLRQGAKSSISIAKVEIDNNNSNGFPGNTHCVDTLNNELHFIGQDELHHDINAIVDSNKDTWFEFELFSITDEVRKQCNSFGFDYNEGISWVNNEDILKLKIIIHLESVSKCSWITLTPYLSEIKGVKNCILDKCEVYTDSGNVYKISTAQAFDDTLVFPFPPQNVERIELTFIQPSKYQTKIGHFYYTSVDTTNMSIFQEYDYSDMFARIDGEKNSIGLLGIKYDPNTKWITYASSIDKLPTSNYIKDKLFTLPENTISSKSNQEILDAYRYMIGIREVNITSCVFTDYSEYISKNFITNDVITSITLETKEYIPGNDPDILRYYISLNNGVTWHQIYPMHRAYQGIYKYYINNDSIENLLSKDNTNKKTKNLSIPGENNSIRVKIEMELPKDIEEDKYCTPIVYQYKLKLTTGGETIEY